MSSSTTRTTDQIVIIVRREPESLPLPYELNGYVAPETWEFRFRQINALCSQYSKPLLERVWFLVSLLVTLILPMVLYPVIFNAITPKNIRDAFDRDTSDTPQQGSNRFDGNAEEAISKYILEARGIIFGVFVGVVLVFWGPLILWKRIGTIRANAMTRQWAVQDGLGGASFVPRWTVRTPGVFTITGRVTISTPPNVPPSLFHPQAYIPPYLMQQANQNGGGYHFYPAPNENGAVPTYMPPPPGVYMTGDDEKRREDFEDVKV